LNYAVARAPKFEIIKSIETAAVRLASERAEDYRAKIKLLLEKCKKFRTNTTPQEEEAIKELAKDKSMKILKADKGNVTVVMNTEDYESKLKAMVITEEYRQINRDPTKAIEAKVQRSLKPLEEDLGVSIKKLAPRHTNAPHVYGLPKVHKKGLPLRAILSDIGSPCHSSARFLLNIIT
jgi:valyl-tRNA synthetase